MTNRKIAYIVKNQSPLVMPQTTSVKEACAAMCAGRAGSVLVVDGKQTLVGIFTGRDAVRVLARHDDSGRLALADVMTRNPRTVSPDARAIDALRIMCEGGLRHVPVVEKGRILGIVSRSDFKGMEIDQLDEEEHLAECLW